MSSQELENAPRLVVIGDSGVGKTCLIDRIISGHFNNDSHATSGQISANKTIEIPEIGKSVSINITDTAGQEKYRSLLRFVYQGSKMAILVYDTTRKDSFDNMKNWWYKDIKEHGDPDIVIGIAGTKSDLYDDEKVPEEEARDFAKSIDAIFSSTSAQNNSGIDELFKNVVRKYLERSHPNIESDIKEQKQTIKIKLKDVAKKKKKRIHCYI